MVGTYSVARVVRALSPSAIASCVVLALGACSGPSRPQLLVIVESELASLAEIRVRTLDEAGGTVDVHRFDLSVTEVPFSFGVAARNASQLGVHLQLDAHDGAGALVGTRTVRTQMDPARRLVVVVRFTADCAPGPVCGEGQTCVDGRCAPDWVDPQPDGDGGAPVDASMPPDDGGLDPRDGGPDTGAVDGGADTCPSDTCACSGGRCTCAAGATCGWSQPGSTTMVCEARASCSYESGASSSLQCARDAECSGGLGEGSELRCVRARCDVRLGAGSTAVCEQRATCIVACAGDCTVDCRQALSCRVSCDGAPARESAGARMQCMG